MTSPQIDIYTSMFCSYCALAKRLLKSRGVSFNEIDVSDSKERRSEMLARAEGRRTVPQIFIDENIGGSNSNCFYWFLNGTGFRYFL